MEPKKQAIVDALYAWINQRPGLDPANYFCGGNWQENRRNYDTERRNILRQRNDALRLLREVELRDSITADDLLAAFRAFSGRLSCKVEPIYATAETCPGKPCGDCCDHLTGYRAALDYCTGQYWPTEYRAAAAAVCASALWTAKRDNLPPVSHYQARTWAELGNPDGNQIGVYPTRQEADAAINRIGGKTQGYVTELHDGVSPGDWMRQSFRREFGAAMQRRYFD